MIRNPAHKRVSRPRSQKPIVCSENALSDIAKVIGKDVEDLLPYHEHFENAALWY